jgi:hypothetical protein
MHIQNTAVHLPYSGRFGFALPSGEPRLPAWNGRRLESGGVALIEPGADSSEVPRQQLVDSVYRMVSNAFEHLAQVVLGVEHVQFCRLGEREDGTARSPPASGLSRDWGDHAALASIGFGFANAPNR